MIDFPGAELVRSIYIHSSRYFQSIPRHSTNRTPTFPILQINNVTCVCELVSFAAFAENFVNEVAGQRVIKNLGDFLEILT